MNLSVEESRCPSSAFRRNATLGCVTERCIPTECKMGGGTLFLPSVAFLTECNLRHVVFEKCHTILENAPGKTERLRDSIWTLKKLVFLDVMHVLDYENGVTNKYRLNGLSWEKYATRKWAE